VINYLLYSSSYVYINYEIKILNLNQKKQFHIFNNYDIGEIYLINIYW
jgi:hypothetical protein